MNTLSRYLDTAAVSMVARAGSRLVAPCSVSAAFAVTREVGSLPAAVAFTFAPNATLAMLSIIEQRVLYAGYCWKDASPPLHPVVRDALKPLTKSPTAAGPTVHVRTLSSWITGELYPDRMLHADIGTSDLLIIDAVQSFGALALEEVESLLEAVRGGAAVVGCLHKWLGSPVPLGFAVLPIQLLKRETGLRDHLAARDYLGSSLGPREGFDRFPDTFAATLAPFFSPLLRIAFGLDREGLEKSLRVIARNRDLLAESVLQSSQLKIIETAGDCRAIVAAYAPSETAETISSCLLQAGFAHTLIGEHPVNGAATLRLSAPLVEIDDKSRQLLQSILASP